MAKDSSSAYGEVESLRVEGGREEVEAWRGWVELEGGATAGGSGTWELVSVSISSSSSESSASISLACSEGGLALNHNHNCIITVVFF